jgi:hypothetical protein
MTISVTLPKVRSEISTEDLTTQACEMPYKKDRISKALSTASSFTCSLNAAVTVIIQYFAVTVFMTH